MTIGRMLGAWVLACVAVPLWAQPVELSLQTPDLTRIVEPDQRGELFVLAENQTAEPIRGTLRLEVEQFDGQVCRGQQSVELAAAGLDGSAARVFLPQQGFERFGIKWVRADFAAEGGRTAELDASFAYMVPASKALRGRLEDPKAMRFGIAYGASPDNTSDIAAQRSAAIGVNTLRANPYWHRAQPEPNVWDWEYTDLLVSVHGRYGIELQPLVSRSANWAVLPDEQGNRGGQNSAPDPEAWRLWVRHLADHLQGTVRYWEIWNEPDIGFFQGTQEQYIEMLRIAYEEIEKVDPSMVTMTGGFVAMDHHGRKPYMIQRVLAECQDSYDAIAYHTHGYFERFREEIDERLLPFCAKALDEPKPLYFTETGMDTRRGQHHQAITLPKKMVFACSRGALGYTWFNLHDMIRAEHNRQPGFTYGLFTQWARKPDADGWGPEAIDYAAAWPKAAYVAYNTTATLLRGLRFREQAELGADRFLFTFDGKDRQALVAWLESSGDASFHAVASCEGEMELVDLMGNASPLKKTDGRAVFKAGNAPVFVRTESPHPIRFEGILVEPAAKTAVVPGEPAEVEVVLANPFDEELEVRLTWDSGPMRFVEEPPVRVTLGPRQRQHVMARVVLAPSQQAGRPLGSRIPCAVETSYVGTRWTGRTNLPVMIGGIVMDSELPAEPFARVRGISHVVNLSEHDPHTVHLLWDGPRDLAMEAKVARMADDVTFEVVVEDNAFHAAGDQPLDRTDCLQMALLLPGDSGPCLLTVGGTQAQPVATSVMLDGGKAPEPVVKIRVDDTRRTYLVRLPDAAFGWTDDGLRSDGVRFNLAARDNDGRGLKGWMELAPGFGQGADGSQHWIRAIFIPRSQQR